VEGGSLLGLREGARLSIWRDEGAQETRLGEATIELVRVHDAVARWADAPLVAPAGSLRALEEEPGEGLSPLGVFAEGERELARLAETGACRHEPDRAAAELYLRTNEGGMAALSTREGLELWRESGPGSFAKAIRRECQYRALHLLADRPGGLQLGARFRALEAEELAKLEKVEEHEYMALALEPIDSSSWRTTGRPEEHFTRGGVLLEYENKSREEVYVGVLSLTEDRRIEVLAGKEPSLLAPGQSRRIPIGVILPAAWPLEREMRDRYLVVASRLRIEWHKVVQDSAWRGEYDELPHFLRELMPALRGGSPGAEVRTTARARDELAYGILALDLWVGRP
jgi:hypothetical protein